MPTGDFDCPECGRPGLHFVPPSLGEPGFYYCRHLRPPPRPPPRPWSPPADTIAAAKAEALQELALDVLGPPEDDPRDPFERWTDVEVES